MSPTLTRLPRYPLPIEPFRKWILETREKYPTYDDFYAAATMTPERARIVITKKEFIRKKKVWRIKTTIDLQTVDRCLTREGSSSLEELYPLDNEKGRLESDPDHTTMERDMPCG